MLGWVDLWMEPIRPLFSCVEAILSRSSLDEMLLLANCTSEGLKGVENQWPLVVISTHVQCGLCN